ncbi:MAG: hypothetical protein JWP34_5086, partial [Massilia sp.]|nr:hypothetical protein [Massilia sp.]
LFRFEPCGMRRSVKGRRGVGENVPALAGSINED